MFDLRSIFQSINDRFAAVPAQCVHAPGDMPCSAAGCAKRGEFLMLDSRLGVTR